ncbi:MAG: hypothetical protein ACR2OK_03030, partial [Parvibaculales bacterium]
TGIFFALRYYLFRKTLAATGLSPDLSYEVVLIALRIKSNRQGRVCMFACLQNLVRFLCGGGTIVSWHKLVMS